MPSPASSPPPVVTVSASYGAGGSVLAPRLADRLGMRFVDRVATSAVVAGAPEGAAASAVERPTVAEERATPEERASIPGNRLFGYLARAAGANAVVPAEAVLDPDTALREQTRAKVESIARDGGLLLGRAGAVVLATRPRTYHIRLDGPAERRLARAAAIESVDLETARRRMEETDRARTLYVRRLHRVDPNDPALYHLMLDATVVSEDQALEVLALAASAFLAAV